MDLSQQISSMVLDEQQATTGQSFDASNLVLDDSCREMRVSLIAHGAKVVLNVTTIIPKLAKTGNAMLVVTLDAVLPENSKVVIPPIADYITLPMSTDAPYVIIKKRERLDAFLSSIEMSMDDFRQYAANILQADFSGYASKPVICTVSKTVYEGNAQNRIHSWDGPFVTPKGK
jgi:hypothetical protein